jgi:hypothetical protein
LKQKNREATTPRSSLDRWKPVQSDLLLDAGFAPDASLAGFSLEGAALPSEVELPVSEVEVPFSVAGLDASLEEALPLVPLAVLAVSAGGVVFLA